MDGIRASDVETRVSLSGAELITSVENFSLARTAWSWVWGDGPAHGAKSGGVHRSFR